MKEHDGLVFETVRPEDIEELARIMARAFDADSMMHLGRPGGPPGYSDGIFLQKYALSPRSTSYRILKDSRTAGCIILWINSATRVHFLGCIFIDPELQGQGLGTKAWSFVESEYPDALAWRTETPAFSHRNHCFYVNKLGFHIVHINSPRDADNAMFQLEKRRES